MHTMINKTPGYCKLLLASYENIRDIMVIWFEVMCILCLHTKSVLSQ